MIIDFNNTIEMLNEQIELFINNLTIEKKSKYFILNDILEIKTPKLYIPFGTEEYYSNYILKLQLRKINPDKMDLFEKLINKLEEKLNKLFNNNLASNIKYSNKYDPLITIKLTQNKNMFTCNAYNKNEPINILNITSKQFCNSDIIIDTIWEFKNKFYYKIKLKNIFI